MLQEIHTFLSTKLILHFLLISSNSKQRELEIKYVCYDTKILYGIK